MTVHQRPPLDIEQAMDVILAAAAHRSQNQAHREFGKLVLDRYFTQLRDECKLDPIAKGYLDNLIAAMASAVRAFSVERDLFGSRWSALQKQREHELEGANHIQEYSPLKEKGHWGKALGLVGGGGVAVVVKEGFASHLSQAPWIDIAVAAGGAVIGLVLFQVFIDWYQDRQLNKIEKRLPQEVEHEWRVKSLVSYRAILKQFLLSAIKIREEYYPGLPTLGEERLFGSYDIAHIQFAEEANSTTLNPSSDLFAVIDAIVERHFAFSVEEQSGEHPDPPAKQPGGRRFLFLRSH